MDPKDPKRFDPPGEEFYIRTVGPDLTLYFRINHRERLVHMIEDGESHKEVHELIYEHSLLDAIVSRCKTALYFTYLDMLCYVSELFFQQKVHTHES